MSDSPVRFAAVGDVSLGDHPLCVGFGGFSKFRNFPPEYPFELVATQLQGNDIVFGNLECTLSLAGQRQHDYASVQMRGQPGFAESLTDCGFHVMNVANNHSLQHGEDAFRQTVDMLTERNILPIGINDGDHLVGKPSYIDKNGLRFAFLGYSLRPRQYFDEPPLYTEGRDDGIVRDIKAVRDTVDFVVVSVHWGDEFIQKPSPEEIRLGRRMIDAGASLIVGHHPHVLRAVEQYGGGVIAYSLGNFVCDMVWDESLRETAIFQCEFSKDGLKNAEIIPCYITGDFRPAPLTGTRATALLDKVSELSSRVVEAEFPDFESSLAAYAIKADEVHREIRRKSQRFFLRKVWKYNSRILCQQIVRFFRNRLHEFYLKIARTRPGPGQ